MFKMMNILLSLTIGTASVKRSFSQMKLIKTRLRNNLSDATLVQLMKIAIEGKDQTAVSFDEILDVFKKIITEFNSKSTLVTLTFIIHCLVHIYIVFKFLFLI